MSVQGSDIITGDVPPMNYNQLGGYASKGKYT